MRYFRLDQQISQVLEALFRYIIRLQSAWRLTPLCRSAPPTVAAGSGALRLVVKFVRRLFESWRSHDWLLSGGAGRIRTDVAAKHPLAKGLGLATSLQRHHARKASNLAPSERSVAGLLLP